VAVGPTSQPPPHLVRLLRHRPCRAHLLLLCRQCRSARCALPFPPPPQLLSSPRSSSSLSSAAAARLTRPPPPARPPRPSPSATATIAGRSSSSAPAIPGLPPRFHAGIGFASVSPPFSLGSRPPPMPLPTLSTRAATHRPRAIDLAVDDHLRPPLLPPRHTHRARHLPVQPVRPTGGGGG